jgi:ATP-dependent helicase/nuclease subunit A
MGRDFQAAHAAIDAHFVKKEFKHSFRSGEIVLRAVDAVFREPRVYASVTSDAGGVPPHAALPETAPGLVEVWPLVEPSDRRELEGWDTPFDKVSEASPQVRLARRIANTVRTLIERGESVGKKRRPATPGDFLILVRQRGAVFEGIIRALKDAGIAVAGADRLVLIEHIAVMDLLVLADALLLEEDDLALATVLKSPLFGFNDEQLYELAWQRGGTLRHALRKNPAFAQAAATLDGLAQAARRETPFAFYANLLGAGGGRARILSRLGVEATDALDEFMNLALDYERTEAPSLQGFAAWLRAATSQVKRDMEIARDEVRVMTAHGAKGLEASIVILADTTTNPTGPRQPRLIKMPAQDVAPGTPDRVVWAGRKDADIGPMVAARTRTLGAAEDEYRRLLYVAMTRAADRLIVCGAQGQRRPAAGCWYNLVREALVPAAIEEPADDGEGTVWRWRKEPPAEAAAPVPGAREAPHGLPDWLTHDVPGQSRPLVIAPSAAMEDDFSSASLVPRGDADARRRALARGRITHRLLQALPDIASDRRAEAARRHVARAGDGLETHELDSIVAQVLGLIDDPRCAPLFARGSRAEVPIVGRIACAGHTVAVSGQIDRLAVADAVWIADYKTGALPPDGRVPPPYVTQLALYRAVLSKLYADREVRAAIVWTYGPDLMEIPGPALDAALNDALRHLGVKMP